MTVPPEVGVEPVEGMGAAILAESAPGVQEGMPEAHLQPPALSMSPPTRRMPPGRLHRRRERGNPGNGVGCRLRRCRPQRNPQTGGKGSCLMPCAVGDGALGTSCT